MFSEQRLLIAVILGTICMVSSAQSLPPTFAEAPVQLFPSQTVTQFPAGTFLENIAVDESGNLFVTSLEEGTIYRVPLEGERRVFARIDGRVADLTTNSPGFGLPLRKRTGGGWHLR